MKNNKKKCGNCGSSNPKKTIKNFTYPYGLGDDKIELMSLIPVYTCNNCDFIWYDFEAEEIIDKDIEKYKDTL